MIPKFHLKKYFILKILSIFVIKYFLVFIWKVKFVAQCLNAMPFANNFTNILWAEFLLISSCQINWIFNWKFSISCLNFTKWQYVICWWNWHLESIYWHFWRSFLVRKFWAQLFVLTLWICNFLAQEYWPKKCWNEMLVKLTPDTLSTSSSFYAQILRQHSFASKVQT